MRLQANDHQYLCSQLVTVKYLDPFGQNRSVTGNLEEISPTRLCVLTAFEIPLGSSVVVLCQGHKLNGRAQEGVRNDLLGWFWDVELEPTSRWSEHLFLPEHLLDLPIRTKAAAAAA
jgi:hypothetical protein